jgi:hypothetical protein
MLSLDVDFYADVEKSHGFIVSTPRRRLQNIIPGIKHLHHLPQTRGMLSHMRTENPELDSVTPP